MSPSSPSTWGKRAAAGVVGSVAASAEAEVGCVGGSLLTRGVPPCGALATSTSTEELTAAAEFEMGAGTGVGVGVGSALCVLVGTDEALEGMESPGVYREASVDMGAYCA